MTNNVEYYAEKYFGEMSDNHEITHYDTVRLLLSPEYIDLTEEEIDDFLERLTSSMTPEEMEGFWSGLGKVAKNIGRGIKKFAPTVLPIAGTALGTIYGGPAGAAIGGALGRSAGQLISGGKRPPVVSAARRQPRVPRSAGGTSAVNQLLGLIQNPALLQSILGQVMGPAGKSTVRVGRRGSPAPFGAFMNALSQLATQAAQEADNTQENIAGTPAYLLGEDGNFLCKDPAVPEQRARVLLDQLQETAINETKQLEERYDVLTEWFAEAGWLDQY